MKSNNKHLSNTKDISKTIILPRFPNMPATIIQRKFRTSLTPFIKKKGKTVRDEYFIKNGGSWPRNVPLPVVTEEPKDIDRDKALSHLDKDIRPYITTITHQDFLENLHKSFSQALIAMKGEEYRISYLYFPSSIKENGEYESHEHDDWMEERKSDHWVTGLMLDDLRFRGKLPLERDEEFRFKGENPENHLVIFDDIAFTGLQLTEKLDELLRENIAKVRGKTIHAVVPYTSKEAREQIRGLNKKFNKYDINIQLHSTGYVPHRDEAFKKASPDIKRRSADVEYALLAAHKQADSHSLGACAKDIEGSEALYHNPQTRTPYNLYWQGKKGNERDDRDEHAKKQKVK